MPRFSIFLVEYSGGALRPQIGITSAFLQPQPNQSSSNPSTKSSDSESVILTQSGTNPGQWYADITNPVPRYDLYINNQKQTDFSGSVGFEMPESKKIYVKKNVEIVSTAWTTPEVFETTVGKLATPDGGQSWPTFSSTLLPAVFIFPPSENLGNSYQYREAKIVRNSISYVSGGHIQFEISLDPNGPDLANYYVDIMIVML